MAKQKKKKHGKLGGSRPGAGRKTLFDQPGRRPTIALQVPQAIKDKAEAQAKMDHCSASDILLQKLEAGSSDWPWPARRTKPDTQPAAD